MSVHSHATLLIPLHAFENRSQITDFTDLCFFFSSCGRLIHSEDTSLGSRVHSVLLSRCPAKTPSPTLIIVYQDQSLSLSPALRRSLPTSLPFFPPLAGTRDDVVITSADCWCAADGSTCLHAGREIRDCAAHVQGCN